MSLRPASNESPEIDKSQATLHLWLDGLNIRDVDGLRDSAGTLDQHAALRCHARRFAAVVVCAGLLLAATTLAQQAAAPQTLPRQASQPASRQGPRAGEPPQRVRLVPQLAPGMVLRYQMEFRTTTEGHRTGLVEDPQAPSKLEISWGAAVRLEILSVGPSGSERSVNPPAVDAGPTRLRAIYEKSLATARSDTFDPEAAAIEQEYGKLEGRTIEFTLGADGRMSEIQGLQGILTDEKAASAARDWLGQLTVGASLPPEGIALGQKWSSRQPATSAPLAGLFWRTESTYLRNEPCRLSLAPGDPAAPRAPAGESCAVILTRFEILKPRGQRDPTPEEYRKRGLRTFGTWGGSGESLSYVSLRTGWPVSVTQSSAEEMDVTVSSADGESRMRYSGRVRTQSQITLVSESPIAPPQP